MRFFLLIIFCSITLYSIAQNKQVKAKEGDGIHSLLERYDMNTPEMRNEFISINKSKLGNKNYLIAGKLYTLPEKRTSSSIEASKGKFPIFGEK